MRCGIGSFLLVDHDTVSLSNCNRQIIATLQTVGMPKVQAMKQRILSVNPSAQVETRQAFFSAENVDTFDFSQFDYLVDAIDSVTSKLLLIQQAKKQGRPHSQQHGNRKQTGPKPPGSGGPLSDLCLSFGAGDAQRTGAQGNSSCKGSILQRASSASGSFGGRTACSGKYFLCPLLCRAIDCLRGGKGSFVPFRAGSVR